MMRSMAGQAVVGAALLASVWVVAEAQASTFATITIDDDYSDWVGIPVLDADPLDNAGGVDIAEIQVANDFDYLYIRTTYHGLPAFSTFVSVDTDENTGTGFDIFSLGLVGSEASWQNDFPFDQRGGWNVGAITPPAILAPWADTGQRELAIPRASLYANDNAPVFPDNDFNLLIWTDSVSGDVSAVIPYDFAVPEPGSALLLGLGAMFLRRHRR
ncbi:MAG: PEP-CTERM sorting domain-containing protein [bacterium]|nr:PEP-CTERM sorting domain-containing protein [bacterium]